MYIYIILYFYTIIESADERARRSADERARRSAAARFRPRPARDCRHCGIHNFPSFTFFLTLDLPFPFPFPFAIRSVVFFPDPLDGLVDPIQTTT